jgi:hypothetical protein
VQNISSTYGCHRFDPRLVTESVERSDVIEHGCSEVGHILTSCHHLVIPHEWVEPGRYLRGKSADASIQAKLLRGLIANDLRVRVTQEDVRVRNIHRKLLRGSFMNDPCEAISESMHIHSHFLRGSFTNDPRVTI